ncbi:hydroxymethylglutaryl-CoA synthase family protein [Streptomyces canus]|uniref:Polyketide biosynthesis 3-hydroxy-3-methylglutaryl-CoA synthase-like enzyme PksG n=1 Tax=Streptomyces canus TaxID=58343 RepID=A0AAW8FSV4_9ACTN|nr:hydroxymethylglutaryl-CoA synthase [Streptomyces canus]MDQ0758944.1 polyketide biosynthesis 3-hydroxy-3-methylglutaryl-CoA synthase-like enzyme PksG [Streptomyces canus]MDQ0912440.1 polyketide biosynthesis 3-hydroxy-3-methylglutaryl-CoA synthase-like enzyme PksG [Streptomyces canus]MDQ1072427.1 polyketide biosynthesis 3-hydroxy-3-methylglutaryl-CoA synthase-like enzyme PksG [Streptomyces canus]
MALGIEAVNAYLGRARVGVRDLFLHRGLDLSRFGNLGMEQKSVALPCEDAVSNAVNAARPLIDRLGPDLAATIELVVVATESGLDFGKPLSTYVHHHLGLSRRCRSFEVKHACYGGTAALRSALGILRDSPAPDARALVIATDAPSAAGRGTYWEPSEGTGAVALLIGSDPRVLTLDPGASGFHTYEVMDTARPSLHEDVVDADLSLLAYLDCLDQSWAAYQARVPGADLRATFDHLVLHTPFAGMVKGAHRSLLRKREHLPAPAIEADYATRVAPSVRYASQVGNLFSASLYLALCSLLEAEPSHSARRIGLFSYGSGCASEFFSGVLAPEAHRHVGVNGSLAAAIEDRRALTPQEYDTLSADRDAAAFGSRDTDLAPHRETSLYASHFAGHGLLVLDRVRDYHREYRWT